MLYENLSLPARKDRPFFYINAVQTIDGKVQVLKKTREYWPIGSNVDHDALIQLRSHADVLVHGRRTASWTRTVDNLGSESFQKKRRELGKTGAIVYAAVSAHPDDVLARLLSDPPPQVSSLLVTTDEAVIPSSLASNVKVVRLGSLRVDLEKLSRYFFEQRHESILVEGGPTLWSSFLAHDLIDEIFLTIAPKIFGEEGDLTLTLTKDHLLSPAKIKSLNLLSVSQVKDELYLRYRVLKETKK